MIGLEQESTVASRGRRGTSTAGLEPLNERERAWAVSVGRRIRAEFTALLSALPVPERTAAGLERALGVNRAVAHRLLSALATADDLALLTRLPGVEGLRKTTAAARRKLGDSVKSSVTGAEAALSEFQDLIRRTSGSHAKLVTRLRAPSGAETADAADAPPGRRENVRRAMFESVRALCGRSVRSRTSLSIIRPRIDNPGEAEYVHARAFVGYRATPGGLPLVLSSWVTDADESPKLDVNFRDLANVPIEGREVTGLLATFCTNPLPLVASRDTSGRLVQIVDRSGIEPDVAMDAVMAYRLPSVGPIPARLDPPMFLEAVNVTSPTEHMIADFYFHRSMIAGATPSLNLYLGRGTGGCDLIDRWHEQISGAPVLGLLGPGISNAHAAAWGRHAELTRHVFAELGWNPGEFIGFRCEERWPLWQCDYVMSLDYRAADPTARPMPHG